MQAKDKATIKVAAVQATPVFLDREATVQKACDLIAKAGQEGAKLIAFPESFIPGYPDWVWAVPAGEAGLLGDLYAEFLANAVSVPSNATDQLCAQQRPPIFTWLWASAKGTQRRAAAASITLSCISTRRARLWASTANWCPPAAKGSCGRRATAAHLTCTTRPMARSAG